VMYGVAELWVCRAFGTATPLPLVHHGADQFYKLIDGNVGSFAKYESGIRIEHVFLQDALHIPGG